MYSPVQIASFWWVSVMDGACQFLVSSYLVPYRSEPAVAILQVKVVRRSSQKDCLFDNARFLMLFYRCFNRYIFQDKDILKTRKNTLRMSFVHTSSLLFYWCETGARRAMHRWSFSDNTCVILGAIAKWGMGCFTPPPPTHTYLHRRRIWISCKTPLPHKSVHGTTV